MNRLNQITTSRFSSRSESTVATNTSAPRQRKKNARAELKAEDEMFRQIIRTPVPMGFFSMLSNAKKLSPLN